MRHSNRTCLRLAPYWRSSVCDSGNVATIVTFENELAGLDTDSYVYDALSESEARRSALAEYAPVLGRFLLQSQEFEQALRESLRILAPSKFSKIKRATAGQVLGHLKDSLSDQDYDTLSAAVSQRNMAVHGHLVVGVARSHSHGAFEDIGVTLWRHGDDADWIDENVDGTETIAGWAAELAGATRRLARIVNDHAQGKT